MTLSTATHRVALRNATSADIEPMLGRPRMGDARALLSGTRGHLRAPVLVELYGMLPAHRWLRLVGEFWSRIEGERGPLAKLMQQEPGWRGLMTSRLERLAWAHLPDTFTAWRGCYHGLNETGVSFTLREADARRFPFMGRFRDDRAEPVLIEATVERASSAVKVDAGVMEVLVAHTVSQRVSQLRWEAPLELFDVMNLTAPQAV